MEECRTCYSCKVTKPLSEFPSNKSKPLGKAYECRLCNRAQVRIWQKANPEKLLAQIRRRPKRSSEKSALANAKWRAKHPDRDFRLRLRTNYGITPEQFNALYQAQNGCCAICKRSNGFGKGKASKLWVDHDHKTLHVRGLLCQRCNLGIGYFEDSPSILQYAIEYITRTSD